MARLFIWEVVLAYYLGGLKPDEFWHGEAFARALNYPSWKDFVDALCKEDKSDLGKRHIDAYRRLFAKVGLDFDSAAPSMLFDAFVTMVNQLPEQRLNPLKSELQEYCSDADNDIGAGSNIPRGLSPGNFLIGIVLRDDKALAEFSRIYAN